MRYVNYIVNGKFVDLQSVQTKNVILRVPVLLFTVVAGVAVLGMLVTVLPIAFIADEYRTTKYQYIRLKRKYYGIRK
jgi:predicted benzoate:H+ symporter BenE